MLTIGTEEIAFLLKFGKLDHINSLNVEKIRYYVDLEKNSNIVGIGDKLDGCTNITGINTTNIERYDKTPLSEIEKKFFEKVISLNQKGIIKCNLEYHSLQDLETPIFCTMCVKKEDLLKEGEEYIFQFTESQIDFKKDFINYTHVFIIDARLFANKINAKAKEMNINSKMNVIKYYDSNINQAERISDSVTSNIIFWKRNIFEHQKEFRIAFPGTNITSRTDLMNVGKFNEDEYLLLDKDTVLSKEFKIPYPKEFL